MRTPLCDQLGIEFPIFAFTHCRDVVAAVSNAGGFGVLGAVGFSPEQLEIELDWIDEHVGDHPYGVDVVIPGKYEGMGELDPAKLEEMLEGMIPDEHRRFARKLLSDHGVPELPADQLRQFLSVLDEETQRLSRLIESVLDLSRFGAGSWQGRREDVQFADVLDETRARCFESGMNDCLTKPLRTEQLERVIERWGCAVSDLTAAHSPAPGAHASI